MVYIAPPPPNTIKEYTVPLRLGLKCFFLCTTCSIPAAEHIKGNWIHLSVLLKPVAIPNLISDNGRGPQRFSQLNSFLLVFYLKCLRCNALNFP